MKIKIIKNRKGLLDAMIPLHTTLNHYKRSDIREEIIYNSRNREVVARFNDDFGGRPDTLNYPKDILELAKKGATSFHASEELWQNPLSLSTNLKKSELDSLRIGWDLVLDIDCGFFEYSKIAADLTIKALKYHSIKSISCKFSGNKGFHIAVPFEAFPKKIANKETREMFPDAPRRIALYIKELIKRQLGERIMQFEGNDFSKIIKKTNKSENEIRYFEKNEFGDKIGLLNVEPFLNIDTVLISPRHLYRMPYSLHEKSSLVSLPISPENVLDFKKEYADPKNAKISKFRFLDRENVAAGEAKQLIMQAFDFALSREDEVKTERKKEYEIPETALKEDFFPPCIKLILNGMEDGKKRAVFILLNFLTSAGWQYDTIENLLGEWNKKNREPLREVYIVGQLRYHKQNKKKILPPNCPKRESNVPIASQQNYYTELGICRPDNLCSRIKNPVNYAARKGFFTKKEDAKAKENEI